MGQDQYKNYLYAIFFCLLVLLLNFTPLMPWVRSSFLTAILPFQYAFVGAGQSLSREIAFWRHLRTLERSLVRVEAENTGLKTNLADLKEVQKENQVLRAQIKVKEPIGYSMTLAHVISRGQLGTASLISIDIGEKEGVGVDNVVVLEGNLVGKVVEVYPQVSFVRLILDDSLHVAVLDQDSPQRSKGVLRGQYSTLLVMEKILQDEKVEVGDTIITSGEDATFPRGLVVGKVQSVTGSTEGVLKKAIVSPLINMNHLEEVFVLQRREEK